MGPAVRHAQTLRAPTPAAVWRVTYCSQTTAPAKPKMVRIYTQKVQQRPFYVFSPLCCPLSLLLFRCLPGPSPDPVDRLPMLLIANLHDIRCTSLSGSTSRLPSIATKQTMAMDFVYADETVCWIDVGDTPAATQLKCANIPDLKSITNIRTINISITLHRE